MCHSTASSDETLGPVFIVIHVAIRIMYYLFYTYSVFISGTVVKILVWGGFEV